MSPDTPTPPQPAPHPRGVFRELTTLAGEITFRVYRCDGALMEEARIHPEWNPDHVELELVQSLDAICPLDNPVAHRLTCPSARASRLRVL